jgi:hypothetical protein
MSIQVDDIYVNSLSFSCECGRHLSFPSAGAMIMLGEDFECENCGRSYYFECSIEENKQ